MKIAFKTGNIAAIAFTAMALAAASPGPVQAQDQDDVRTEAVQYIDLNLTDGAGIEQLNRRLHRAVTRLCKARDANTASEASQLRACRLAAWAGIEPTRAFVIARAKGTAGSELAADATGAAIRIGSAN